MEREERIKALAMKIVAVLFDSDEITYDDMADAIAYIVYSVDRLGYDEGNTEYGSFVKYFYDMLGKMYEIENQDEPKWIPSTEHPRVDEEVIALVGEYNQIYFAHIVDKRFCVDYDGWNIPDVRWWIPCPKIEED